MTVSEVIQLSKIISIPTLFLHDKYGIPVPSKGDEIAGAMEEPEPDGPKEEVPEEDDKPKKKKRLVDFFRKRPDAGAGLWESPHQVKG